jgi:C1A family cysteine protease
MSLKDILLAVVIATASANILGNIQVDLDSPKVDTKIKYGAWKVKYNKVYATLEEEAKAMDTFAANDKFVIEHNQEGHSYTVGHNQFSDLTSAEFAAVYTGYKTKDSYLRHKKNYNNDLIKGYEAAPTSMDWVAKGAVTPVKNQGRCGSCWAFSTTGSTEGAYQIATGKLVSLAEQDLVDCDKVDHGCQGGLMDNGFNFIQQNNGICGESAYPYTASDGSCNTQCKKLVTVSGHEDVPKNDEKSLLVAASQHPVSVAIEADKPAFQMYKSGVFDNAGCGTQLDHGVLVVGYGTMNGKDYWKVKNSWGGAWGDQGYIMIVRNKNMCGISQCASYPTGAKAAPAGPAPGPSPGPSPGPAPGPSPSPTPPGPPGPVPTFATEWTANITQSIVLANGQQKSASGTSFQSAKNNATRFDNSNGQTIVTLFNEKKQMLVVNGACKEYCPTTGEFFNDIQPSATAVNKGNFVVNGKKCTDYHWEDKLFKIITMDINDLYVDSNNNPVQKHENLTPFGKASIGNSTENFNSFRAGDLPADTFAVSGIANCQKSPNCQQKLKFEKYEW